jgi:CheY-like chemotaxis protein
MVNILWADDDNRVHFSARLLLANDQRHRYNIHKVFNGHQAVEVARSRRFDLCVMDINMPEKNGVEAAKEIHSLNTFGYMPIIAATAGSIADLPKNVFDDVLEKPFDSNGLLAKIDQWYIHTYVLDRDSKKFIKELPMNQEESTDLLELRKRKLGYLRLRATGEKFVVHENVPNKISYDFAQGNQLSTFLERAKKEPTSICLYKDNLLAHSWELTKEEFEVLSKKEDELLNQPQYQKLTEVYLHKK